MALENFINKFKEKVTDLRSKVPHQAKQAVNAVSQKAQQAVNSVSHSTQQAVSSVKDSMPSFTSAKKEESVQYIDIKASTVVKVVLIVLSFLYLAKIIEEIQSVIVLLLLAVIVSSSVGPLVDRWHAKGMNRIAAALLIYLIIIALLTILFSSFIPLLGRQIIELAQNIGALVSGMLSGSTKDIPIIGRFAPSIDTFLQQVDREALTEQIQAQLQNIGSSLLSVAGNVWQFFGSFLGGLFFGITILMLSFYMVIQQHSFEESLASLIPAKYEQYVLTKSRLVREKMGAWLRGQLLVCSAIALIAFIGLLILGVPYPHTLAIFAGLMAIIPYLGPAIGAAPSLLIALSVSPLTALGTVILFFVVIQFLETNFITPLIMGRVVGLNPVTIITVLLIGGSLFGLIGILLAIPVTTAISVFVKDYQQKR